MTEILMCISPEIQKLLGTQDYYSGAIILPIIIEGYFLQFLYTWPVNCSLYYKKTRGIAIFTVIAAALNIILNIILIPKYGILGAAIATMISFFTLFLLHQIFAMKCIEKYEFSISWFIKYIIVSVLFMVFTVLALDIIQVRWAIAVVLGVFILRRIIRDRAVM
jgi:O-antigen/teichoic acid export membrane protein